jgi:Spy/CpxP family protein refolding chaperone
VSRPLTPRRVWLLAAVVVVLTFVAGSLAGAAWERWHHAQVRRESTREQRVGDMLKHRYDLSDAQKARIEIILRRRRPRVDSLMALVQPRIRSAFDSTNAEIRVVLTPGQRVKFDRDQARRRRDSQRQAPPGPPPASVP